MGQVESWGIFALFNLILYLTLDLVDGTNMKREFSTQIPGREEVHLEFEENSGQISDAKLHGVGGPELLQTLAEWRPQLKGALQDIPLPEGSGTGAMMVRELLLKARGQWQYPYEHEELCHCRVVTTQAVDAAVLTGSHDPSQVSKQTSASTACGTCRPDVEAIIAYRLGKSQK